MTRTLIVLCLLLAGFTVWQDWSSRQDHAAWEARIEVAEEFAQAQKARADSLAALAEQRLVQADSIAVETEAQAPEVRERIVTVRDSTPADLRSHPAVVVRDSIIDALQVESESWQTAYHLARNAAAELQDALQSSQAAADSLSAVLEARPSGKPWYMPELGVGPSVGVAPGGTVYSGVGVNLSWRIPL